MSDKFQNKYRNESARWQNWDYRWSAAYFITVSSIIGSYKSAVTKHANRLKLPFGWQTRFHDHVIRNDEEYQRIENYIANNPAIPITIGRKEDKFH